MPAAEKHNGLYVYAILPNDWWHGFAWIPEWIDCQTADDQDPAQWGRFPDKQRREESYRRLGVFANAIVAFQSHSYVSGVGFTEVTDMFVSALPSDHGGDGPHFFFTFKVRNNGDTYVMSPVELPWLRDQDYVA